MSVLPLQLVHQCHFFRMEDKIGSLKSYHLVVRVQTCQRVGHRAIQIGHNILVFGGTNAQNQFITSILRINSESTLIDIILTNSQLKLEQFSLFSYKEYIYLWGGNDPAGVTYLLFQPTNRLYKFIGNDFQLVPQSGQIPSPRSHHASYFFSKRYLLIQGGTNNEEFFRDFFILDCHSMTWNKVTINIQLPYFIKTHVFWSGGRGFFMTGQTFDPNTQKINYQHRIYELRFTDVKQFKMNLDLMTGTQTAARPIQNKKQPTVIFINFQCPYLMVIGGQLIPPQMGDRYTLADTLNFKDVWIFNLETLEWIPSNIKLNSAGFGFQAVYLQERVYLIGGISSNYRDLASNIEVIDINSDCLQTKLCKVCREMYGVKDYSGYNKQFSIKFQQEEKQRTFFSVHTIAKMAKFIRHPFSAIGLLIDNCINLNGTLINIEFKFFDLQQQSVIGRYSKAQTGSLFEKTASDRVKMRYNYIIITDDTCGFSQNEIVECMSAFGLKTQKLTTDKKYEEQLQIRKEYGVNIKLGALRLAQSCLCVTKTEDDSIFVCYFSTIEINAGDRFQIISYFITEQGKSSDINYNIIKANVIRYLPADYERLEEGVRTKVYLFNLQYEEMVKEVIGYEDYDITYKSSVPRPFHFLKSYLESLYFTPYTGRFISLENSPIKFKSYPQILKKDENEGLITKLNINLRDNPFKHYGFYKFHSPKYPMKEIMVYHQNRLIFAIDTSQSSLCGYIVIPATINLDLCKTKIESYSDQVYFTKFISKLIRNHASCLPSNFTDPSKRHGY